MGENKKIYPKVKDVLRLLGAGTLLTSALIFPHASAFVIKEYKRHRYEKDKKEWERFNLWRLKEVIKRLEKQKVILFKDDCVQITEKGKKRVLLFTLEDIVLNQATDGKWRLIIYDIANFKKKERDLFRSTLKRLHLLQLQESVYLTPFVCEDEIEYLRQVFSIGKEVQVIKVSGIENEQAYKKYFGI